MDERVAARAAVVRPRELGDAETERWRALQATDRELQNPFLSPAFARAVHGDGPSARRDLRGRTDDRRLPALRAARPRGRHAVATDLSLTTDAVFSGWFAAHDPELARVSPGAIRTLRTVEAAFDRGVDLIDLSRGDESYKDTLKTGDSQVATGFIARPSTRAYAYHGAKVPVAAARSYVLRHPGLRSLVRESLKRVGDARERITRP